MSHEFLIDGEGRRWCGDGCPADAPHWTGEFETVYEIPPENDSPPWPEGQQGLWCKTHDKHRGHAGANQGCRINLRIVL